MKRTLLPLALVLLGGLPLSAAIYSSGTLNTAIPDGNINPSSFTITVSGEQTWITDVNVTLNLSGGYNADLYGYLMYNGVTVVLLNRIGVTGSNPYGASGEGMHITLSDGATDIHTAGGGYLMGTWAPDGRTISPLSTGAQFDAASRQNGGNPLGLFNGLNPNGTWTLYFADLVSGDTSTLVSWSLEIQAVPEPTTWALGIFGVLAGGVQLLRRWRRSAGLRLRR